MLHTAVVLYVQPFNIRKSKLNHVQSVILNESYSKFGGLRFEQSLILLADILFHIIRMHQIPQILKIDTKFETFRSMSDHYLKGKRRKDPIRKYVLGEILGNIHPE